MESGNGGHNVISCLTSLYTLQFTLLIYAVQEHAGAYSCNNITTTLIQISRLFILAFFPWFSDGGDLINSNSF